MTTTNVLSVLDRDQGQSVIPGIMDAKRYPMMTSWSFPEYKLGDLEKVLREDHPEENWEINESPYTLVFTSKTDQGITSLCRVEFRLFSFSQTVGQYLAKARKYHSFLNSEDLDPKRYELFSYHWGADNNLVRRSSFADRVDPKFRPEVCGLSDLGWIDEYLSPVSENLLFLFGEKGTGKTQLARYILTKGFQRIGATTDTNAMAKEEFWNSVRDHCDAVILDDVDVDLSDRKNNDVVRKILTFCDGVENNNIKIIITTNQMSEEFDEALHRPGRCFDGFAVDPMTHERARKVWQDTLGKTQAEYDFFFEGIEDPSAAMLISFANRTVTGRRRKFKPRKLGY